MSKCKNCNAPIEVKQGRRPREFCDNNQKCRNEYFRKNKKAATHKTIPIEQWNEIQAKIAENNLPENKERILAERNEVPKTFTKRVYPLTENEMIPPMPTKNEGEDSFDFAQRKNEWKKKYNQ